MPNCTCIPGVFFPAAPDPDCPVHGREPMATLTQDQEYCMRRAMQVYGGSFVKKLAECFAAADSQNTAKLLAAFPEYVEKYLKLAQDMPEFKD